MIDCIVMYYKDKRLIDKESADTALNMTIQHFWFNRNLMVLFMKSVSDFEKEN